MNVWIVNANEPITPLTIESRPMRTGMLTMELLNGGHQVTRILADFDHGKKSKRSPEEINLLSSSGIKVILLKSLGYKRNVSIRRIIDHFWVSFSFLLKSKNVPSPDIIVCSFPTIELAFVNVLYAKINKIPVLVDVRDLWPDIFLNVFNKKLLYFGKILLAPYNLMCRFIFANSTGIVGITSQYSQWGKNKGLNTHNRYVRHFPIGYFGKNLEKINSYAHHYPPNEEKVIQLVFVGSLGFSHDTENFVNAIIECIKKGFNIKVVICGDGDRAPHLHKLCKGYDCIKFTGWISRKEVSEILAISDIGIVPLANRYDFLNTINNKTTEYLAFGLAVITSPTNSLVADYVTKHNCGIAVDLSKPDEFVLAVERLINNKQTLGLMRKNSRRLFDEHFDAEKIYKKYISFIEDMC